MGRSAWGLKEDGYGHHHWKGTPIYLDIYKNDGDMEGKGYGYRSFLRKEIARTQCPQIIQNGHNMKADF